MKKCLTMMATAILISLFSLTAIADSPAPPQSAVPSASVPDFLKGCGVVSYEEGRADLMPSWLIYNDEDIKFTTKAFNLKQEEVAFVVFAPTPMGEAVYVSICFQDKSHTALVEEGGDTILSPSISPRMAMWAILKNLGVKKYIIADSANGPKSQGILKELFDRDILLNAHGQTINHPDLGKVVQQNWFLFQVIRDRFPDYNPQKH